MQWNLLSTCLEGDTKSVLVLRGTYYQGWFMYIRYIHRDRMRSTYYPAVCTKPGTYYQGWFMYIRYTQGQNEESSLSMSVLNQAQFHCTYSSTHIVHD